MPVQVISGHLQVIFSGHLQVIFCVASDYGMSYSSNNQIPASFSPNPLATPHASRSARSTGLEL
jgi:hypothetical protein